MFAKVLTESHYGPLGITLTPFQIRVFGLDQALQALIPKKAGPAHTYYSQELFPLFPHLAPFSVTSMK